MVSRPYPNQRGERSAPPVGTSAQASPGGAPVDGAVALASGESVVTPDGQYDRSP